MIESEKMLTNRDKGRIKTFFNHDGYVFNFSDATFDEFTVQSIGTAIKEKYGLSKARSLGRYIDEADDEKVSILVKDLLDYYDDLPEITHWKNDDNNQMAHKLRDIVENNLKNRKDYLVTEIENVSKKFGNEYIEKQISLMVSLIDTHPADSIGKSKELIESCCKYILDEEGISYKSGISLSELRKQVFILLNLDSNQNISAKSNKEVKKILSSFTQIIDGINNLRNEKGDGHGRGKTFVELPPRYARLVVNASIGLVQFIWETYEIKSDHNQ